LPEKYFTALQTIVTDKVSKASWNARLNKLEKNIASLNSCGKNLFELVC